MAFPAKDGLALGHHHHLPCHQASSSTAADTNAPQRRNYELFDPPSSLDDYSFTEEDPISPTNTHGSNNSHHHYHNITGDSTATITADAQHHYNQSHQYPYQHQQQPQRYQEQQHEHQYSPIDVPLIAELPADSVFPSAATAVNSITTPTGVATDNTSSTSTSTTPRPRSYSPSTSSSFRVSIGVPGGATARLSTYSQFQPDDEDGGIHSDGYPTHPIKSMQGPFEESITESIDPTHFSERDTMDAVSRRQQLLELEDLSAEYSSRWRRRPGAKFHPLWKLIAQISFGIHLLHTQTAKSDEEVVRILQTHVDEVDGFLEDTSNDFALALKDIYERNRFLSVPLEHGRTFDKMLRDREFRTAIIEGNETIEHIVERTSQAMHFALQDIIQGIDATAELAKFLDRLVPQCMDNSEMIKIYAAMRGNAEGWWRCFCDLQVQSEKLTKLLSRLESILMEVNRRTGMASRRKLSKGSTSSSEHSHIARQQRSSDSSSIHKNSVSSASSSPVEGQQRSRRHSTTQGGKRRHHGHAHKPSGGPPPTSRSVESMTSLAHKASQISFLEKPLPPDPLHAAQAAEHIRTLDPNRPIPRASRTRSQPPTPNSELRDPSIRQSRSVENLAPPQMSSESFATVPEEADGDVPESEQVMKLTAENLAPIDLQFHVNLKTPADAKSKAPTIPDRSNKRPGLASRAHTFERPLSIYKYENPDAIKSSPNLEKWDHRPSAPSSVYPDVEVGLGITRPKSADGSPAELLPLRYEMPADKPRAGSVPNTGSSVSLDEPEQNAQVLEKVQTSIRESSHIARLPSIPTLPSLESDDGSGSNTIDSAIDSAYASGGDSGLDDPLLGLKKARRNKLSSYYDVPESIINLVAEGRASIDMTALPRLPADGLDVDLGLDDVKGNSKQARRPSLMAMKSLFASKRSPRTRHFAGGGLGGNVAMI